MTETARCQTEPVAVSKEGRLRWWKELALAGVFYGIYTTIRDLFGSSGAAANGNSVNPVAVAHAYGHALDIIHLERSVGLYDEPRLQRWYLSLAAHGLIRVWNIYYGSLHFLLPIAALVWLYRARPGTYRLWRNTLAATTALALVGFSAYDLMPPRLLDASGRYGACNPGYHLGCHPQGVVDTLSRYGGLWNFGSGAMANISNQYAAMPSLHTAWATWSALVLWQLIGRGRARATVALYPAATVLCIIVTGNHYWIDAVAGLATLGCGYLLAAGLSQATRIVGRYKANL